MIFPEKNLSEINNDPIVALLDGVPLQNHKHLEKRIVVTDPNGFESNYPATARIHSTGMASLIIHGDLNTNQPPLNRKIVIYPIMVYDLQNNCETMPENRLAIDIVHKAILNLVGEKAAAPNLKIVNFSIGDYYRPFLYRNSTWAKLIDYLSYTHKILFIVSAGNYNEEPDTIPMQISDYQNLDESEKRKMLYNDFLRKNHLRKILTPAETLNGITVGATNFNESTDSINNRGGQLVDIINNEFLPAYYSRIGFGYRMSVKPDILMPGGRQVFLARNVPSSGVKINIVDPPIHGHKVATSVTQGRRDELGFSYGTSVLTF